jgi:hypothetical protein
MRELNNGTEELEPPVTQKKLDKRRNLPPRKPALLGKGDVARKIQPIRGRVGTCVGVALLTWGQIISDSGLGHKRLIPGANCRE